MNPPPVSTPESVDVAVIGAGAAGLAACIFAAESRQRRARIVALDGAAKVGAKILVAGGGRCNVTNERVTADDFSGPRNVVKNILREFDERAAVEWFARMGVELKTEPTGKLFPVSDDAHSVLEALLARCAELSIEVRAGCRVESVAREGDGFRIEHCGGSLRAQRVVMATGGRSLPKTGSDGTGWKIARQLGHTVTPTYPALVPLVLDPGFFHARVAGVSHDAELSTIVGGKPVDRRSGSLLWTHFGVSGPVVMDASRFWVIAQAQGQGPELRVSFLPGKEFADVDRRLIDAAGSTPGRAVARVLAEPIPRSVAEVLCRHVGLDPASPMGGVTKECRKRLVHALISLALPVVGDRGWNYAEVTAGGVPLGEVNPRTMESRIVPGLYLVGEIIDCDGRIGGFNFQWAWATGHVAGQALHMGE